MGSLYNRSSSRTRTSVKKNQRLVLNTVPFQSVCTSLPRIVTMKSVQMLCWVLLVLQTVYAISNPSRQTTCEPLKIKMCKKFYNRTVFPNFAGHRSQWEANLKIQTFSNLLSSNCSKDLRYLTCAYYAPVCTSFKIIVKPCRSLCRRVKKDCAPTVLKLYGKAYWPKELNCKKLPKKNKNTVCFGRSPQKNTIN